MKLKLARATELELSDLATPSLQIEGDAEGEGFGALQMFAASNAICTASVLMVYAQQVLHVSIDQLQIAARWQYAHNPQRVARLELSVHWPELPEDRRDAARRAADSCTLHQTLEHPPELVTRVTIQEG